MLLLAAYLVVWTLNTFEDHYWYNDNDWDAKTHRSDFIIVWK